MALRTNSLSANILKITSLFGSIQIVTILCGIVRAKLVAIWIGAAGVGLFAIYFSAVEMICTFSQLGLRESAVRDIARAKAGSSSLSSIVRVVRRWAMMLGVVGALLTVVFSGVLSRISFGDYSHWVAFAVLASVVWMMSVNGAEKAVFQGLRNYRKLALCSVIGAVGGVVVSVPMFYFWRIDSIVPALIAYSAITWIAMGVYREKVGPPSEHLTMQRTLRLGKRFMILGIYITASTLVSNFISYAMLAYLNRLGGEAMAGFYNAGFTVVNRYVGMVFTAISMEYYPRLSAVSASSRRLSTFVSNQLFLSLAVLVPIALVFICAAPLIMRILYSSEFLIAVPFISFAMAGTVFRAISWCMSFVMLAKADGKAFFVTEILSSLFCISLNIAIYPFFGLTGIGVAYIIWYMFYTAMIAWVYFRRYRLSVSRSFIPYGIYSALLAVAGAAIAVAVSPVWAIPFVPVALAVSWRVLKGKLTVRTPSLRKSHS